MVLPEKILVLDDNDDIAENIIQYLKDLSWMEDFSKWKDSQVNDVKRYLKDEKVADLLKGIDSRVKSFFRDKREHFKNKIEKKIVKTTSDAKRAENILEEVKKNKTAVAAFIDFVYDEADADAQEYLSRKYDQLPEGSRWGKVADIPKQKGGCYFSEIFDASIHERRLNCMATLERPFGYPREATIEAFNARNYLNALRTVITMLNEWAKLFWDPGLDDIWKNTTEWFKDDRVKDSQNPTFCHPFVSRVFENKDSYKNNVRNVFGLELPSQWFEDNTSFMILHESLKSLCGSTYCGTLADRLNET